GRFVSVDRYQASRSRSLFHRRMHVGLAERRLAVRAGTLEDLYNVTTFFQPSAHEFANNRESFAGVCVAGDQVGRKPQPGRYNTRPGTLAALDRVPQVQVHQIRGAKVAYGRVTRREGPARVLGGVQRGIGSTQLRQQAEVSGRIEVICDVSVRVDQTR